MLRAADLTARERDFTDQTVRSLDAIEAIAGHLSNPARATLAKGIARNMPGATKAERVRLVRWFSAR